MTYGRCVGYARLRRHAHSQLPKYCSHMSTMDRVAPGLNLEAGTVNLGDWYDQGAEQWPMNYGQSVPHEMVRPPTAAYKLSTR
jgi:hypothetical protein